MELKEFNNEQEMQDFFEKIGYSKTVERIISKLYLKKAAFVYIWNRVLEINKDFLSVKRYAISWVVINELRKELKLKEV
jgi:hypothetical protein